MNKKQRYNVRKSARKVAAVEAARTRVEKRTQAEEPEFTMADLVAAWDAADRRKAEEIRAAKAAAKAQAAESMIDDLCAKWGAHRR